MMVFYIQGKRKRKNGTSKKRFLIKKLNFQ